LTSIIIAIVLSLDAFSVALSLGLTKSSTKSNTLFAILVGIFHFIMPSLGSLTSFAIFKKIVINGNKLLGFVLIILTIQMLLDLRKNREFTIRPSIILLAFSVSVDSFFTGMGLGTQKDIKIANYLVFSLFSFIFSILGCKLGVAGAKKYDKIANWAAIIILFMLSVKYLFL
jgi:putative Mn2+ efflux pump MntP